MASGSEIERKFLVARPPGDLEDRPSDAIEQGYVAVERVVEVRLRRRTPRPGPDGARRLLTVKSGAGRVRVEEEFEIDERRFESLWPLTEGRRVAKVRYRVPADGGLTIEVDRYTGELDGLILAEVEFDSEEAGDSFEPPAWFEREVTDDLRYANRALAVDGAPPAGAGSGGDGADAEDSGRLGGPGRAGGPEGHV